MTTGSDNRAASRLGEVIESASDRYVAQAHRLYGAPPLGTLVRAGTDPIAYGVVCHVETRGLDPSRRPVARGHDLEDEDDVYRENPQLERLFRTEFRALLVGHLDGERVRHELPPSPPRIHAFVHQCAEGEVRAFTGELGFLELLTAARDVSDDAVAACLRLASAAHADREGFLVRAGKHLALLWQGQGWRLNGVLRRLG